MTTLRVATYNIYLGADLTLIFGARDPEHLRAQAQLVLHQLEATWFPERAETVAALLARERVDVVGLQEVARWAKGPIAADGSHGPAVVWCDYLTELLEALERAGTPYDAHAVGSSFFGSAAVTDDEFVSVVGYNVILVRRDGQVTVDAEHTGAFMRTLDIGTGTGDRPLTIRRGWGSIGASAGGMRFRCVNTHTEAYDADTRDAQRDELLAANAVDGPVVVVGDFNAVPEQVGMPAEFEDAWLAVRGDEAGHTCGQAADLGNEDSLLRERIDYIWVRGADVRECAVVGGDGSDRTARRGLWPSDHACVVAEIALSVGGPTA